jgi:hypothetical protein
MDIQIGDKITFQYKNYKSNIQTGVVSKFHSSGNFSVKREKRHCLQFHADGSHANYEILSIEKGVKQKAAILFTSQNESTSEYQKARELIALSSFLLRLAQRGEATDHESYDYAIAVDTGEDVILIDHCDEGFEYRLQSLPDELDKPLATVSMLRSLIMYREES